MKKVMKDTQVSTELREAATDVSADIGQQDFETVVLLVKDYCDGLHFGDVDKLRSIFHPDVFLKAPNVSRSLNDWLADVAARPVPAKKNQPYNFKLISIEVIKDQAIVKLECPLFNHSYVDLLGLLKEDGRWLFVNKMYTDLQN
jgi:hypothetical protein